MGCYSVDACRFEGDGGAILLEIFSSPAKQKPAQRQCVIPPEQWVELVATMSKGGYSLTKEAAASELHAGVGA